MLQNLSSAAVMIGALRVKIYTTVENVQIMKPLQFRKDFFYSSSKLSL